MLSKQQTRLMGFALFLTFAALKAMAADARKPSLSKPQEAAGMSCVYAYDTLEAFASAKN